MWSQSHLVCQSEDVGAFDVVVVGSANLDLVVDVERLPSAGETLIATRFAQYAGGKGLNQAVAAARMGARTAFVGCVGSDDAGSLLRRVLDEEGVDTSLLQTVEMPTGRAMIAVDVSGENTIVVAPGANSLVAPSEIPEARVVLAQLEIPFDSVSTALSVARATGAQTILNPAPATALSKDLIAHVDVIVPNEHEVLLLGGVDALLEAGVRLVITTRGAKGAEIASRESVVTVGAHAVMPIDTVGAGDAFIGALCAEIAMGTPIRGAVETAVVAGALATTVRGAVPSLPRVGAVRAAMRAGR